MIRHLYLALVIWLAITCLGVEGYRSSVMKSLVTKFKKDRHGVVYMSDLNFTRFLSAPKDRDWYTIVLYNLPYEDDRPCTECKEFETSFKIAAKAFKDNYKSKFPKYDRDLDIMFVIVHYPDSQRVFRQRKVTTVPVVDFFPALNPKEETKARRISKLGQIVEISKTPEILLEVFKKYADNHDPDIQILQKPESKILILIPTVIFFSAIAAIANGDGIFHLAFRIFGNKTTWLSISLFIYFISVSGTIFCIINSTQLYGMDGDEVNVFAFKGQSRNQGYLEGWVVGSIYITFCFVLLSLVLLSYNVTPFRFINSSIRVVCQVVLLTLAIYLFLQFIEIFESKQPFVSPNRLMISSLGISQKGVLKLLKRKLGSKYYKYMMAILYKKYF
jgi:hypothetical protein